MSRLAKAAGSAEAAVGDWMYGLLIDYRGPKADLEWHGMSIHQDVSGSSKKKC